MSFNWFRKKKKDKEKKTAEDKTKQLPEEIQEQAQKDSLPDQEIVKQKQDQDKENTEPHISEQEPAPSPLIRSSEKKETEDQLSEPHISEQKPAPSPLIRPNEKKETEDQLSEPHISEKKPDSPLPDQEKETPETPAPKKKLGFFSRLKNSLKRTNKKLSKDIDLLFDGKTKIDDDLLEELEEILITSDIGVETTIDLIERISKQSNKISDSEQLKQILQSEISTFLQPETPEKKQKISKPYVIMVVGVNGVGKTTTIGKLAAKFSCSGQKVLIGAADTFRAAASEQLEIWADRAGADIVKHKPNSDPAAVAYDSVDAGLARDIDIVIIDTAGRLHTKINLMEELKKIKRSITKRIPDAPHETLLVLDATTGQNGLSQAQLFNEALDLTGIALAKLDGTAKGGIVVSICNKLNIPLKYIGIGEKIEDIEDFNPVEFAKALFSK